MCQCSHVYPAGSPALLLCSLHYQSAWQVFFHFTSSQWLASFVTHTFHKVSVLYFIAFEANKQKGVWGRRLVQILFSILIVRSTRDLLREGLVRKWPQQLKTLQLGFLLTIDRGTLEEYYALWGAWTNLGVLRGVVCGHLWHLTTWDETWQWWC